MMAKSSGNGDGVRKWIMGVCIGISVVCAGDFFVRGRAEADANIRQDGEITLIQESQKSEFKAVREHVDGEIDGLRRDVDRHERQGQDLLQICVEILKTVKEKE